MTVTVVEEVPRVVVVRPAPQRLVVTNKEPATVRVSAPASIRVVREPAQRLLVRAAGARGERGPAGGGITLQFNSAASWPVAHNLGRFPVVDVIVDGAPGLADVFHIDANNFVVQHPQPTSGFVSLA